MKIRSAVAALATAVVTGSLCLAAPATATPTYDRSALNEATHWALSQLNGGLLQTSYEGIASPAYGPSADLVMSLVEANDTTDAAPVASALATNIDSYVTSQFDRAGAVYAGSTAKAAVALKAAGLDPNAAGPNHDDLIAMLDLTVQPSGRIQDISDYGDYENTLGQAFAVAAFTAAGGTYATRATSATTFLLTQQCDPGWFRLYFDSSDADASCDSSSSSGPSVDATATALLELAPQITGGTATAATARAVGRAEAWLLSVEQADGGWSDGIAGNKSNANSTALAGRALAALGHTGAAEAAAIWVRAHQLANVGSCKPFHAADVGALAFDGAAWSGAQTKAVGSANTPYTVAISQALGVLNYLPVSTSAPNIHGPSGYLRGGTSATYAISGLAPGAPACLTLGATHKLVATNKNGAATASLTLPASTGTATATVSDGTHSKTTGTKVLGARTLTVAPSTKTVTLGHNITIGVLGLASGEKVTVTFRGKRYAGSATSAGTFRTPAIKAVAPVGAARVTVVGQFSNRTGASAVTVAKVASKLTITKRPAIVRTSTHAKLVIKVKAPSASVNGGKVTVKLGRKLLASGAVRSGRVVLKLPKLKHGKHYMKIHYAGTSTAKAKSATYSIKVK